MVRFSGARGADGKRIEPQTLLQSLQSFETILKSHGMNWREVMGFDRRGRGNAVNATLGLLVNKPHLMGAQFSGWVIEKHPVTGRLVTYNAPYMTISEAHPIRKLNYPQVEDWAVFNDLANRYFDLLGWSLTIRSMTHAIRKGMDGDWRPRWVDYLSRLDASLYSSGRGLDQSLYMV